MCHLTTQLGQVRDVELREAFASFQRQKYIQKKKLKDAKANFVGILFIPMSCNLYLCLKVRHLDLLQEPMLAAQMNILQLNLE